MFRVATVLVSLLGLPSVTAAAEDIVAIAEFGEWSLFNDTGDCWVVSYAKDALAQDVEEVMVYVAFHRYSTVPDVSVWFEEGNTEAAVVKMTFGAKRYVLPTDDDTAYGSSRDNSEIFALMLDEQPTTISVEGMTRLTEVQVAYDGFREAYLSAAESCTFHHHNDVDGNVLTEPA